MSSTKKTPAKGAKAPPKHIAIIMDGNGRWAHTEGKSRQYGHKVGSSKVYEVFKLCTDLGCKSATFFAMSSENMQRNHKTNKLKLCKR